MSVVYKYEINPYGRQTVTTLDGPIIHVGLDPRGVACIWVQGEPISSLLRWVYVTGTGHQFATDGVHAGSYVDGPFVWHVFDEGNA